MKTISKTLWLIVGTVMPILIGALHTLAHFKHLVIPEVKEQLQMDVNVFGESQILFDTWGLMSFMMGMSFIVIGLINLSVYNKLPRGSKPPLLALFAMLIYLLAVIYVGSTFGAAPQFYGGIFGLVMLAICAFAPAQKDTI